jgi:hypothetical protein
MEALKTGLVKPLTGEGCLGLQCNSSGQSLQRRHPESKNPPKRVMAAK